MRRFARRLPRWFAIVGLSQQQLHGMVFATDRKDGNSRIERPPTSFGFCMGERLFFRVRPIPEIGPISESACCWRLSRRSGPTLVLEAPLFLLHICFSDRLPGARSALKCKTVPLRGTGARRFLHLFRDGLPWTASQGIGV